MLSKSEFVASVRRGNPSLSENDPALSGYDDAVEAAAKALRAMPSIGFASSSKRYDAFVAVCRHLDSMVENGFLSFEAAQLAIVILRLSNKPFTKAAVAFDIYGPRLGAGSRAELPFTASQYLAAISKNR